MPTKIILTAIGLLFSSVVFARSAPLDEVPLVIEKLARETTTHADGTFVDRWSWRIKVQKREAREDVGTRSIRFYKSFEQVKILRAGTKTDGQFKEIQLKDLQERTVTDESPGFSSLYEYVLSFPNVQEGSELDLDYEVTTTRALEPGFWGESFLLDAGAYEGFSWIIHSEKPLYQFLQDPASKIRAKVSKNGTEIEFKSRGSFSLAMADESDPYVSNERKVLMMAGFLSDWKSYGVYSASQFEIRAKDSLAPEEARFVRLLPKGNSTPEKIQSVLQHITGRLRYFGDWRTSEQMYIPRPLAEISRTLYGDCKDFALLAVKMLREAGLTAKPVWVLNSDETPPSELYRFPTDNAFNHVIVWVSDGKNDWWVDPTNPISRPGFLADETAGRPGLVLDPAGSQLRPIRRIRAEDYRTITRAEVNGGVSEQPQVRVVTSYEGMGPVTAGEQIKTDGSTAFFDEHLQRLMPAASMSHMKVEKLDLADGNELRGYKVSANFENFWVRTSGGPGFSPVREDVIEKLRNLKLNDREGDVALGKVYSYDEDIVLNGFQRIGDMRLDCAIHSPWIEFSQKVTEEPGHVTFHSSFALKEAEMVLTKDARPKALQLQRELRDCAGRVLILLKPISAVRG